LLKLTLVELRLTPGAMPVPLRLTVCGLVLALSVTVSVPLSGPVVVGAKLTLMVQLPLAARVEGLEGQLVVSEKLPLVTMLLIVRGIVPVLLRVTGCEAPVVPTAWLPKEGRVEGETEAVGAVAVPVKVTVCGLLLALSVMVRVPFSVPDTPTGGVKVTLIVQAAPAPMPVPHVLAGERVKSLAPAVNAMLVKDSVAVPESVTVTA
jgi:hypothetical protein